jgi:hypothetical protein
MTYLKAPVSERARRFMATAEGRRRLLTLCIEGQHDEQLPSKDAHASLQAVEKEPEKTK